MNLPEAPLRVERRAIGPRQPIVLRLPFPPPGNALFLHIAGRGRVPSEAYAAWRARAADAIHRAKPRRMSGAVEILMTFSDRPGRCGLDNLPKACLEILVAKGLIESSESRIVRRLNLRWGNAPGATIEIRALHESNASSGGGRV